MAGGRGREVCFTEGREAEEGLRKCCHGWSQTSRRQAWPPLSTGVTMQ